MSACCIIGTDFPSKAPPTRSGLKSTTLATKDTSWNVWYDATFWCVDAFHLENLNEGLSDGGDALAHRRCGILHLSNILGAKFRLMVMKNLVGTKLKGTVGLQLDQVNRQHIMHRLFSFLQAPLPQRDGVETMDVQMVVGDFGLGLGTLHTYMREHKKVDGFHTHCNQSQTIHAVIALAKAPVSTCTRHTDTERMTLLEFGRAASGDVRPAAQGPQAIEDSNDVHPPAPNPIPRSLPVLKSRARCQVDALTKLTQGSSCSPGTLTDSDDAHLTVELLYQPCYAKTKSDDGCWHNHPIDVELSAKTFTNALALVQKLRRDVGVETHGTTLTTSQFDNAYRELKKIFEEHFVRNETLRARVHDTDAHTLDRAEKQALRTDKRGAFKAWCKSVFGSHAFLLAILRHGLFEFTDLHQYARLLIAEREKMNQKEGGVEQPARNQELRRNALQARKAVSEAKQFAEWHSRGWQLKPHQTRQVMLLENGDLHASMKKANAAYGHGVGAAEGLTKEKAVTLEVFTSASMAQYFGT